MPGCTRTAGASDLNDPLIRRPRRSRNQRAEGDPQTGLRVLVVGAGNSGAEIATDLSQHAAAAVTIRVRTPPAIVPRDPFGLPVQRTSILLSALPPAVANVLGRTTARMVLGDLTRYGMPQRDFTPYSTRRVPIIDVGFVDTLKSGRVTVRAEVERLTPTGAIFADGTTGSFHAIIAATGFTAGIETLLDAPGALDEHGEPRGRSGDRRRIRVSISTVSFTASAVICSKQTCRRAVWRETSNAFSAMRLGATPFRPQSTELDS